MPAPSTPQVELIAHPTGAVLQAPTSNRALELADSLKGVNQSLGPALEGYAKDRQAKLAAQAHADAMAASGDAFANAVRSGKIKDTQNPWYIQAYERDAAAVRAQGEVSALVQESQSFASRNDASAFQQEFQTKLGEIAKKYQGVDQAAGFQSTANPLAQQTIQQNVQYNVARIREERNQNISTLATTNILSAVTANGGHPTAAQVFAAIEPQHAQWIATGGTESDWNQLTINSVVAAGFNSGNAGILAVLDDPRDGKGALSNIAGPDGVPIAQSLATARYRIEQEAMSQGMAEIRAQQNAVKLEGMKAEQAIWDKFGYEFLSGAVSGPEVIGFLQSQGISPAAASFAVGHLAKAAGEKQALTRAQMGGDPEVLQLYTQANRGGFTSELASAVADKVRTGGMDVNEAEQILGAATSRSNHFDSEARQDARASRSDARAASGGTIPPKQAKAMKQYRERLAGTVATRLEQAGVKVLRKPAARKQFERGLQDAESTALMDHPGDPIAARTVVDTYAAAYIKAVRNSKGRKTPSATGASQGNPRR